MDIEERQQRALQAAELAWRMEGDAGLTRWVKGDPYAAALVCNGLFPELMQRALKELIAAMPEHERNAFLRRIEMVRRNLKT